MINFLLSLTNFSKNFRSIWTILCFDKPKVLDALLPSLKNMLQDNVKFLDELHHMCHIFQSHECMKVLKIHGLGNRHLRCLRCL